MHVRGAEVEVALHVVDHPAPSGRHHVPHHSGLAVHGRGEHLAPLGHGEVVGAGHGAEPAVRDHVKIATVPRVEPLHRLQPPGRFFGEGIEVELPPVDEVGHRAGVPGRLHLVPALVAPAPDRVQPVEVAELHPQPLPEPTNAARAITRHGGEVGLPLREAQLGLVPDVPHLQARVPAEVLDGRGDEALTIGQGARMPVARSRVPADGPVADRAGFHHPPARVDGTRVGVPVVQPRRRHVQDEVQRHPEVVSSREVHQPVQVVEEEPVGRSVRPAPLHEELDRVETESGDGAEVAVPRLGLRGGRPVVLGAEQEREPGRVVRDGRCHAGQATPDHPRWCSRCLLRGRQWIPSGVGPVSRSASPRGPDKSFERAGC